MNRYSNKRIMLRTGGGQFRKAQPSDLGIMGVCPKCQHLLLRHYDGDPRDEFPNPRKFRNRCFNCEPLTDADTNLAAEIEASKPKPIGIIELFKRAST